MATGQLDDDRKDEPREWRQRSHALSIARNTAAKDVHVLLRSLRVRGSFGLVQLRVGALLDAEKHPDWAVRRAASMELAVSALAYAASIDLDHPFDGPVAA